MYKCFCFFFAFLISFAHAQESQFHRAALIGDYATVKNLLDQGTDPNVREYSRYHQGETALYFASSGGHLDVVNLLIDRGAYVNALSGFYNHAFIMAAANNHYEVAKTLLDRGADFNIENELGWSFMHFAAAYSPRITQLLLDRGAHHSPRANSGETPIFQSIPDYNTWSQNHRKDSLILLLNSGVDINDQVNNGSVTLLMAATFSNQVKFVRLLLERGANKSLKDIHQKTACDYAQELNNAEMIEILGTCQ